MTDEAEGKIPGVTNLAAVAALNAVGNKTVNNLVKKISDAKVFLSLKIIFLMINDNNF